MLFNHFVYLSLQAAKFCCLFVGNLLSKVLNDVFRWWYKVVVWYICYIVKHHETWWQIFWSNNGLIIGHGQATDCLELHVLLLWVLLRNVSGAAKNSLQSVVQPNFAARHVKRKLELIKRYDSHINVVIDDGKLRYIKQCDHCGMEFRACRPDGRFCCTKCHDQSRIWEVNHRKQLSLCPVKTIGYEVHRIWKYHISGANEEIQCRVWKE